METTNLSKIKRDKMLNTLKKIKENITDEEILNNLSLIENELIQKKYGLIWEEHEERVDKELVTHIPTFLEIKDKEIVSKQNDSFNFLLEGDNLHSLYLLEKTHKGKIDVIYIDPPYNTGKEDFIYNDKNIDELDAYKHSKWLSFMEKRLKIAHELLSNEGIIFISIDENEFSQLKLLCDDIFDEANHLSTHHIQVRYENKSLNEKNDWQPVMEYVLIYSKNHLKYKANKPYDEYNLEKFIFSFETLSKGNSQIIGGKKVTIYKNGEWTINKHKNGNIHLLKETWASGSVLKGNTSGKFFDEYISKRKEIDGLGCLYKVEGIGEDGLGYRYFTGPQKESSTRGKFYSGIPLDRLHDLELGISKKYRPITNYVDYSGDFGNIRHEGNIPFNSGKKPVKMLKELINYHPSENALILDFFAGSGSTAQAVLELNQEDNGNRKFILCTNNENNICEDITYKRIKNVIDGYGKYEAMPTNLKYYRCTYIPRINTNKENLHNNLLINIKNLIQLENGIEIDNEKIRIYLNEEELDKFSKNKIELEMCDKIYISSDILVTSKQEEIFKDNNIEIYIIPEYYFEDEINKII